MSKKFVSKKSTSEVEDVSMEVAISQESDNVVASVKVLENEQSAKETDITPKEVDYGKLIMQTFNLPKTFLDDLVMSGIVIDNRLAISLEYLLPNIKRDYKFTINLIAKLNELYKLFERVK